MNIIVGGYVQSIEENIVNNVRLMKIIVEDILHGVNIIGRDDLL